MSRTLDIELAASCLVTAALQGDQVAADQHGVTVRSIQRYRKMLPDRPELSQTVAYRLSQLEESTDSGSWMDDCTRAIRAALDFIVRSSAEGITRNPDHLEAVSKALAVAVDAQIALRLLDERVSQTTQAAAVSSGPVAAGAWASGPGKPHAAA